MATGNVHKRKKKAKKASKSSLKKAGSAAKQNAAREDDEQAAQKNPKAFVFSSRGKARTQQARSAEKEQRRMHVPRVAREPDEPPPFVVLVHGPPGVGKTTLIKGLVKHYTRQNLGEVRGPITLVAGKARRLTFIECPQDLNGMIDASKYADLVLLMVDGAFGFEMETFEFLNLLQVQGFPKVMGVLTYLDTFKDVKKLKKTKKALKHRFWAEIYQGAKLFYLSGMRNGKYLKREILNLARFISVMKFRPLTWRLSHPYLIVDRFEDVTSEEAIRRDPKCDRDITLFGYSRGSNIKPGKKVGEMDAMPDPCPLPSTLKQRGLNEKERLLYAPMADVGGLLFDKDAVYIDVPNWKVNFSGTKPAETEGEAMVRQLQRGEHEVDRKLDEAEIQLFDRAAMSSDPAADRDIFSDKEGHEDRAESDSETKEEADASPAAASSGPSLPSSHIVKEADGRVRRRAVFQEATQPVEEADGNEEEVGDDQECEDTASMGESEDSKGLGAAAKWKEKIQQNVQSLFSSKSVDMQHLVYGSGYQAEEPEEDSDKDDLFRPCRVMGAERPASDLTALDALDTSRLVHEVARLQLWESSDTKEMLRSRFVTGDWEQGRLRDAATPGDDVADSDEGMFSDFEDMEIGLNFGADGDRATAAAIKAIQAEEHVRVEEKTAKKAAFDTEYDVGGSSAVKDKSGKVQRQEDAGDEEETYYDAMKKELAGRATRTKAALDALDCQQRIAMEGFRPGTYLRLHFRGLPCELVQHFSPLQPLLIGGLSTVEENRSYLQLRLKRHRWFPKVLKTRDPLTFSVGWRRFQSLPVYAVEDQNGRHRMLKYTPEHMHCLANIYGAMAPTNTGVVAIQSAAANQKGWRISATGVVVGTDAAHKVVKKLKLTGTPTKVLKNTAFITGMFNSPLEVAKFEGAAIRTVSGLRGTIKKASHPGRQEGKAGTFRATFEDKVLMSDIVFLRAWVAVDLPRFYNPVTNLLAPLPARRVPVVGPAEKVSPGVDSAEAVERLPGNFIAAATFAGAKPGSVFTTGALGTGYYSTTFQPPRETHQTAAEGVSVPKNCEGAADSGWVGMKTVAQLRRELGIGAPRNTDSLYHQIERTPRKFNPLKIPKSLQAELPYSSKPKDMAARKRSSLEQRRAVVLEPGERKAVTLVQQLNALRNAKEGKRRTQQVRRRKEHAKKVEETETWRQKYSKEERKKRAIAAGLAEKRKSKRQRTS